MPTNFKQKTPRCSGYLKFLRTLPCCRCGTTYQVQSHHTDTGGIALVGSDWSAVPLCLPCHQLLHQKHSKSGFWKEEELSQLLQRLKETYHLKHGE